MAKWPRLTALFLAACLVLAPGLASARAGGSYGFGGSGSFMSQGSRGFQSYNFNGAQPLQRSLTPRSQGSAPYAGQPGYSYGYGYHPFASGLAGGFFGSWLGSLLFPHWGMGYGWGFPSVIGSVFSWLFLIGIIWIAFRLFAGRGLSAFSSGNFGAAHLGPMAYSGLGRGWPGYGGNQSAMGTPLAIVQADYQAFETVLKHVQGAWSQGDLGQLRHYVTPEMLSYFSEQLAENESRGVANHVEDVELLRGDLRQAWDEGRLQYATCFLHWRARDYTVRTDRRPGDPDYVVGGDPQRPSEAAEAWTFVRSPGGQWLLSAIQQI